MIKATIVLASVAVVVAGCAMRPSAEELDAKALAVMKAGFKDRGQAKVDRLDQDELQRVCSKYSGELKLPEDVARGLEKAQLATIKYPADGKLLGDWREGEKIAQSGQG
ncbi:MAG: hypothetical protein ACRD3R_09215, partial [Terriglobales bacterium]